MLGPLTPQQATFFAILLVAIALLITERLRTDLIALLIILSLAVTGTLHVDEALSGFSSEPAIVIACMFVLSAGLEQTGLSDLFGRWIGQLAGKNYTRMLAVLVPAAALLSAAAHHVTITAVLLPVTLLLARDRGLPPSKLLLPMAVGSSLGTTITGLGAPAFLVARDLLSSAGQPALNIPSIAPIGLALTVVGTLYWLTLGRLLLPNRKGAQSMSDHFRVADYVTELAIPQDSALIGCSLPDLRDRRGYQFAVSGWLRGGQRLSQPLAEHHLRADDVLLVRATPEELVAIREDPGVELKPIEQYSPDSAEGADGSSAAHAGEDIPDQLVQAIVAPGSSLAGRTIAATDFRRRYGVVVLGLWRRRGQPAGEVAHIRLREGDVLVLQGGDDALERIANDRDFLMLVPFQGQPKRRGKAALSGVIMVATIALAALNWFGLAVAALAGATAMVLTRCLTPRQAYRSVDTSMYLFVAGAIPLGKAMQNTGSAQLLAGWVQGLVSGWSEMLILLALFGLVGVVVQFMGSDSATVALFGPLAIALAQALNRAPEPFVVAVAMAAVTAVLTPMSHHNLLIYGPGGYKFGDYTRVGAPLTILLGLVVAFLAPIIFHA